MKKFIEYEDPYADLNEIGQAGTLKFCFAKSTQNGEVIRGQHVFVKCRDFLNDVVIACDGSYTTPNIYGFQYDGEDDQIDTDKTRLVLLMRTKWEPKNFLRNLTKLNNMLKSAGMEPCRVQEVEHSVHLEDGENTYFMVEGDKRWSRHVTSLSFYTLLLRTATVKTIDEDNSFAQYLRREDLHDYNDWEYLSEFNRAFKHPAEFIKNMELLSMENVHMSIRECDEMEHAHERGGIMVFSVLVHKLRTGKVYDYIENECGFYDEVDLESIETITHFPTLPDARRFV